MRNSRFEIELTCLDRTPRANRTCLMYFVFCAMLASLRVGEFKRLWQTGVALPRSGASTLAMTQRFELKCIFRKMQTIPNHSGVTFLDSNRRGRERNASLYPGNRFGVAVSRFWIGRVQTTRLTIVCAHKRISSKLRPTGIFAKFPTSLEVSLTCIWYRNYSSSEIV
jgi:hypothetical protein